MLLTLVYNNLGKEEATSCKIYLLNKRKINKGEVDSSYCSGRKGFKVGFTMANPETEAKFKSLRAVAAYQLRLKLFLCNEFKVDMFYRKLQKIKS